MTLRRNEPVRVALYDAAGRGGVAQYTYFLAEGLAGAGARVKLLTSEDYEMGNLPRGFELIPLFRPSRIGAIASSLKGRFSRAYRAARRPRSGAPGVTGREPAAPERSGRTRELRLRLLLFLAAVRLAATGTRVLHVQWGGDRRTELWFLRLVRRLGIRTVHTAHDLLPHEGVRPGEKEEISRLYRSADHVVALAEKTRRGLIADFGVAQERVSAIPHGGDETFSASSSQESRRALGLADDRKVILFFGTIRPYKGIEYLIQAFDRVRERLANVSLLVAGGASPISPDESAYYEKIVSSLRGRPDVVAALEYVPVDRIGLYFSAADVVALPYVRTSHSGVLLMAYASGRPVVVTDTGGLAECVEPGKTGFVVPPCDVARLSEAIESILDLPDRGKAMGERARRLSEELYSWSAVGERHLDLYRRLLAPASSVRGSEERISGPPARDGVAARAGDKKRRTS